MARFLQGPNYIINLDAIVRVTISEVKGKAKLVIGYGLGSFVVSWGEAATFLWERLKVELKPEQWNIPKSDDPPEGEQA